MTREQFIIENVVFQEANNPKFSYQSHLLFRKKGQTRRFGSDYHVTWDDGGKIIGFKYHNVIGYAGWHPVPTKFAEALRLAAFPLA